MNLYGLLTRLWTYRKERGGYYCEKEGETGSSVDVVCADAVYRVIYGTVCGSSRSGTGNWPVRVRSDNRVGAKVRDRSGNRGKSESGWQPEAVRVPESVRWPGAAGMQERMQCPEASEATGEIRCPEVAEATGKKRCPEVAEVTKIPEQTRRPEAVRDPEQTRRKEPGMVRGQKPGR